MNLFDIKDKFNIHTQISNSYRRLKKNTILSRFYEYLSEDILYADVSDLDDYIDSGISISDIDFWQRRVDQLKDRADRVALCSKFCKGDYYTFQGIKDLQRLNLCRDRFCDNCQNTLSIQRSEKYSPLLYKLSEDFDIYHIVLTVPNCTGNRLSKVLDCMYFSFQRLVRCFSGRIRVRNVDFLQYGYSGCIRSLEITKNTLDNTFHPHFHCLFLFKKGLNLFKGSNINSYSFSNVDVKRQHRKNFDNFRSFSDFEIFLQKLWRCLYDGDKLTFSSINSLSLGYSVICNFATSYKEIFKYATKGILCVSEENSPVSVFEDFVVLFFALYRRKITQGYGILYSLKFDDVIDTSPDDLYLEVVSKLHELENPERYFESFQAMHDSIIKSKNIIYITRSSLNSIFAEDFDNEK